MSRIKSKNSNIWNVPDIKIDRDSKEWIAKNLFVKKNEDWMFCDFLYTDMEVTDLIDTVSVLDNNNTFEIIDICPDIVDDVYQEFLKTNLVSKILPFILFCNLQDIMPFVIGISDPRILSVINWKKSFDEKQKSIADFVEEKVKKEYDNFIEKMTSAINEVEDEDK
jgi:hypothetical protein